MRYVIGLPTSWDPEPRQHLGLYEFEHIFDGPVPVDRLAISVLPAAVPGDDLRLWVDAALAATGFPVPALADDPADVPLLLEWEPLGPTGLLTARLAVDEACLYQGLARLAAPTAMLARIYVLLARRGSWAWQIALSIESACPPGTDELMVAANDHARGACVFGGLELLEADAR